MSKILRTGCIINAELLRYDRMHHITRISVMSRHTESCGKMPDVRITSHHFDRHWMNLGPHPRLIGSYYNRGLSWHEFAESYRASLIEDPDKASAVRELIDLCLESKVRILCIEETSERCHRRLLAEHCATMDSALTLARVLE